MSLRASLAVVAPLLSLVLLTGCDGKRKDLEAECGSGVRENPETLAACLTLAEKYSDTTNEKNAMSFHVAWDGTQMYCATEDKVSPAKRLAACNVACIALKKINDQASTEHGLDGDHWDPRTKTCIK